MRYHRLFFAPSGGSRCAVPSASILVSVLLVGFVSFLPARPTRAADFFTTPLPASDPAATAGGDSIATGRLVLVHRVLHQDQGDWQVDYTFRNVGAEPLTLQPRDLGVRTEGWLSNSRIAAHANPRRAECAIDGQYASTGFAEVIAAPEETRRCRERVVLAVLPTSDQTEKIGPSPTSTPTPKATLASYVKPNSSSRNPLPMLAAVVVEPGNTLRIRLRFEHQHIIYGDYDPLLGRRDLELRLGSTLFRDALPLHREQHQAMPRDTWPEPPDDRRDRRFAVAGPDSLHLDADFPGNNYFRFPERKVRYSTPMRLRFWYRVAPGTEGELHARVAQYRVSPESYKPLPDGAMDIPLTIIGHWVRFEKVFRTESEATELALDFRISPCDTGEAWIDAVTLEPADTPVTGP